MAEKLGDAYVELSTRDTGLVAGLNKAQSNVAASMKAIGRSMAIAGAAIVAGFGMAIKTAAQFEQSMANTASVAGATAEELKKLSDYAREMGEQSVFSASEAADAMYYLASAGMNTTEIMGALEGTLALAAATASDLAYTSESVAATLSQFGLAADEAGRVANVFAAAISGSQATMDKLSTSMSYVGPMAKSMGMALEDTVGILMNLYNAGLDGSSAGTALRMAFVKLIEPTEKGTAALEGLEVAIKNSDGEMRPFKDIIDDLGKAGMTTADAMAIFGVRSGPGMLALVSQGTGAIQEMTDAVTGTEKATKMAAMQIDTFEGAMKLLRSAFEELQITLVQDLMPALKGMIEQITEGIKKVSDWMKENPKLTETIVKWTAGVGALMLVLGPLLMILPGLVAGIVLVKGAILKLNSTVLLVTANIIIWYNVIKEIDKILRSHHTTIEDVEAAENRLAEAQEKLAEKLSIGLTPATEKASESAEEMALALAEVERVAKETEESIKKLTETTDEFKAAQEDLADKIFELTHTAMEVAIKKLDEERQSYIDLGMSIEEVNKWYDLEIKKLEKLYKIEDKVIGKTKKLTKVNEDLADSIKEMGRETGKTENTFKKIAKTSEETFERVTTSIYRAGEALSDFSTKAVAAAITSIKMRYIPEIEKLRAEMISLFFPSPRYAYKIEELTKRMSEAISQVMYGYKEYQRILAGLEAGGGGTSIPAYQHGTPYVPRTGLAIIHKGEAIIPASQNTYNQQKSYASSINIQPGAIIINTPRFSGRDAKEMLAKIKREAAMQGYKFATA